MLLSSGSSYKPMPKLLLAELIIPNQVSPVRTSVRLFHITGHPVGMTEYLLTEYHLKLFSTSNNTHTRLMAPCPGLPRWASTRKVKPIWILLKQETLSGSGISWAICKSAPRSRQITMPAHHHSVFLQAGCPSCHQTNSAKALKANSTSNNGTWNIIYRYWR